MNLSIRHGTTLEPAIEHFFNSSKLPLSLPWWNCQMINALSMKICNLLSTRELFKFLNGANADNLFSVIGNPERDGITPKPISWETPVTSIFEPIPEPALLDGFWDPISLDIILDKVFFDVCDFDKPAGYSLVNERSIASPAERIVVLNGLDSYNSAFLLQIFYNFLIAFLYVDSFIVLHFTCESSILIERHWGIVRRNQLFRNAHLVILLTETGSTVHDACTSIWCNEAGSLHFETAIFSSRLEIRKYWHILQPFQITTFHFL